MLNENVSPHTAHLLAQISFLYKEVERLEQQLHAARNKGVVNAQEIAAQYEKVVKEKVLKAEEWRQKCVQAKELQEDKWTKVIKNLEKENAALRLENKKVVSEKVEMDEKIQSFQLSFELQQSEIANLQMKVLKEKRDAKLEGERAMTTTAVAAIGSTDTGFAGVLANLEERIAELQMENNTLRKRVPLIASSLSPSASRSSESSADSIRNTLEHEDRSYRKEVHFTSSPVDDDEKNKEKTSSVITSVVIELDTEDKSKEKNGFSSTDQSTQTSLPSVFFCEQDRSELEQVVPHSPENWKRDKEGSNAYCDVSGNDSAERVLLECMEEENDEENEENSKQFNFAKEEEGVYRASAQTEGVLENRERVALHRHIQDFQQKLAISSEKLQQLLMKISILEKEKSDAMSAAAQAEHDRDYLESQLHQYEKDVGKLVAHKNFCASNLDDAALENDRLHHELQRHADNENKMCFTIQEKDEELHDLLKMYNSAVRENEFLLEGNNVLQRELDNIRSSLSSKDDSIQFLREQLNDINHREQQLLIDIQSFECETDQNHRIVAKQVKHINQIEKENANLKQIIHAKDISVEELHQHLADLNKQIVIQENDSIYRQRRCDDLEAECSWLQAGHEKQSQTVQELEDANASLMAKSALVATEHHRYRQLETEVRTLQLHSKELENTLISTELDLEKERKNRLLAEKELNSEKALVEELQEKNKRLRNLVEDQKNVLSSLAT